ncbi:hypothetical protein TNCV_912741 [Trichonephila clavipes]|nr:hypothetical protein TNCV_912741 [Trichonephila clavipes]
MHRSALFTVDLHWHWDGLGSQVVKVWDRGWLCHEFEPSTTKDPRVGERRTINLSRAEMSSRWCGVVGEGCQLRCHPLDHGSKLRDPSPKALM